MRQITTTNYVRISKKTARALYKTGQENRLYFCPVNLNPENPWGLMWNAPNNDIPFDQLVSEYQYYNCDAERGYYTAFYVPREWYELRQAVMRAFSPDDPAYKVLEEWEAMHP